MQQIGVLELRNNIGHVLAEVKRDREPTLVTKNGKPCAVIIDVEDYNSMLETLYLLGNSANNQRIDKALEELDSGKVKSRALINV